MCDWVCYLLESLDSNKTYIGSSNDCERRLFNHNRQGNYGAKYTRGQTWIPVIFIDGFTSKRACLSFESGWKRLSRNRSTNRALISMLSMYELSYNSNPVWNRIIDLFFFVHNFSFLDEKYISKYFQQIPYFEPNPLCINKVGSYSIDSFNWPHFLTIVDYHVAY